MLAVETSMDWSLKRRSDDVDEEFGESEEDKELDEDFDDELDEDELDEDELDDDDLDDEFDEGDENDSGPKKGSWNVDARSIGSNRALVIYLQ